MIDKWFRTAPRTLTMESHWHDKTLQVKLDLQVLNDPNTVYLSFSIGKSSYELLSL